MLSTIIGLLSLRRGHNVARLDTRAPGSLRHAARLETSWPRQWLRYLAAVVSICEYTVSNKGGLPCHCHDCGRLWVLCAHPLHFVGATAPTAPPPPPPPPPGFRRHNSLLPSYSPDLNPAEEVKSIMKANEETLGYVDTQTAVLTAFNTITPHDCMQWITHA